jgi:hypothetical protein
LAHDCGLRVPDDAHAGQADMQGNSALCDRASQFSRYLLERIGIPDRDKNARLNPIKLIKYSRFRAFLAPF